MAAIDCHGPQSGQDGIPTLSVGTMRAALLAYTPIMWKIARLCYLRTLHG
jgi:hypothetical protein